LFQTLLFIIIISIIFVLSVDVWVSDSAKEKIYSSVKSVPKRDVALLLGTAKYVRKGKINYFYKYRIEATAKLYYYNEPARMRRDLIKMGIPKSKIYLDFAGFRTLDSILRAKEIFGLKKCIIVSQKFHLERALYIAKKSGVDAIGFVAKDYPGTKAWLRMRLREYLARVKAFMDIYILHTTPKFFGKFEKIEIKENSQ